MFKLEVIAFMVFLILFVGGIGSVFLNRRKRKTENGGGQGGRLRPERVHLTPDDSPQWVDQEQVQTLAQRLVKSGFTRYQAFQVDEIPALNLLFFRHPKTGIIAEIAWHLQHGLSVAFSTLYKNGDLLTVTNSPEMTPEDRRPGWEVVCQPGADLRQLAAAFIKAVKPGRRVPADQIDIERLWEDTYFKYGLGPKDLPKPVSRETALESEGPTYQIQPVETDPLIIGNLSTLVAKVVLDRPELPPVRKLSKRAKAYFRKGPKPSRFKLKNGVIVFNLPGGSGAVTLLPHPLPDRDLAFAVRDSSHWPEAAEAIEDHGTHLIVTVNLSKHSLVERHLILTRLTAAVTEASRATAVYWCHSGLLFNPSDFEHRCRTAGKENPPLSVWINHRITEGRQGHNLHTQGLAAFNLMELEMVASNHPVDRMVEFATVMSRYLIDNGPVIRHGDTFGPDHKTKITVVHEPSQTDPSQTVYRVMF